MLTFEHLHDGVEGALQGHFAEDNTMAIANERMRVARILVHLDRRVFGCEVCRGLSVNSERSRVGAGVDEQGASWDREDGIKIHAMTGQIDGLVRGIEPSSVGVCLNLDGNCAEGW